jgi:transcriptional regulator with XRE-family HTH domain
LIAILTKKLFEKLRRKTYRQAYVEENVRTGVAYQIRALREARGWSQKRFAEILGKPQSVLSRIEDPDYGKLSVQTLLEVAAALDIALLVQYVDFPDFINRTSDVSPEALNKESFAEAQFIAMDTDKRHLATLYPMNFVATIEPATWSFYTSGGAVNVYIDTDVILAGNVERLSFPGAGGAGISQTPAGALGMVPAIPTPTSFSSDNRTLQ